MNVNDSFFDGEYKNIWTKIIPPQLTLKEVDFMIEYFKLDSKAKVLDIMCGNGRHALQLARRGVQVEAVDNLPAYVTEISEVIEKESLSNLNVVLNEIQKFRTAEIFDLIIWMGNSANFYNKADLVQILSNLSASLRNGGKVLINTWTILEIAVKQFKSEDWSEIGDTRMNFKSQFLFHPTRIETETEIQKSGKGIELKFGVDYLYSINELGDIFEESGLELEIIYSIPGRKEFEIDDPRAYVIASKA